MATMVRLGARPNPRYPGQVPKPPGGPDFRQSLRRGRAGAVRRGLQVVLALVALGTWVPATAQTDGAADLDTRARALFRTIMSPYCPGSLLNECPSSQAAVLRDSVRARLGRGQTPEQIRRDLVRIYGEDILAAPPMAGLGSLAWLGVIVAFLGGLVLAGVWLQRRRQPPEEGEPPKSADIEGLERVRRELAAHEEG